MTPAPPSAVRQAAGAIVFGSVLLVIAAVGGGWLALGRADPLFVVPGAGWAAVAGALACVGRPSARLSGGISLAVVVILALVQWAAAGWVDWLPTFVAGLVSAILLMAAWAVALFARSRSPWGRVVIFVMLAACAWGWQLAATSMVARAYTPVFGVKPARAAVVTSLPLFAPSRGDLAAILGGTVNDAPAITALQRYFDLVPMADVDAMALEQGDALLLAHPAALSPETLVAIDAYVRGGGQAVVLADALLDAELPYPLGDPRNPPVSTMLDPLLSHWGLAIAPARAGVRLGSDGRHRLMMSSAGEVAIRSAQCRSAAGGLVARCRIGRGQAVIVGDADLLDPSLWRSPAGATGPAGWRSANIGWLADQLQPCRAIQCTGFAQPVWMR